jgi:hypothetical protein
VFTARYAINPSIKQIRFAFKGCKEIANTQINAVRDTSYEITDYMSRVHCSVYPFFFFGGFATFSKAIITRL